MQSHARPRATWTTLQPGAAAAILSALVALACTIGLPAVSAPSGEPEWLRALRDREALQRFLAQAPLSCFPNDARVRVCTWRIDEGNARGPLLASVSEPQGPWWLLCAIPSDRTPRGPGSCRIAAARYDETTLLTRARAARRESAQHARDSLDAASDLLSLSRLVGHGPTDCQAFSQRASPHEPEHWVCRWNEDLDSPGYETALALLGAYPRGEVLMACELPVDGSPRSPDSCRLRIAGP